MAANIDTVFIMSAAGPDLKIRRLERYRSLVHASAAEPVILINKADLVQDPALLAAEVTSTVAGVPVIPISAINSDG